jgi:hypothetical protein
VFARDEKSAEISVGRHDGRAWMEGNTSNLEAWDASKRRKRT